MILMQKKPKPQIFLQIMKEKEFLENKIFQDEQNISFF